MHEGFHYKPNFVRQPEGNVLPHGQNLIIKVEGATIVTGVLRKAQSFFRWKVIQIEQSGHRGNPEKDQITFEMVKYDRTGGVRRLIPMPRGKYKVSVKAHSPTVPGDTSGWENDVFLIQ